MAHEVFISYSHLDAQIANALVSKLEDDGLNCWIAPRNISAGQQWADSIAQAIPKSKIFIIVFSSNSNSSDQVLREVELAIHNKLVIVPMRIEDIMPTGGMLYYLATTQWIDVKGPKIDNKLSMISMTVRNILTSIEKGTKPAEIKPFTKKKPENKKTSKKALIIIICSVVLIAAGLILFIFRDTFYDGFINLGDNQLVNGETPNPDMLVEIEDEALNAAIITALENMGETIYSQLTVADMQKLEVLKIASTAQVQSYQDNLPFEVVSEVMSSLIIVDDKISSISGLKYAVNLKQLMIGGKNVKDLSPIKNLTSLIYLDLPANNISDISPLKNLTELKTLDLSYNNIEDIKFLENMTELEILQLTSNNINDISAVEPLEKLTLLNLNSNNISNIDALNDLLNLESLSLQGNPIQGLDAIKDINLQYVFLGSDMYALNTNIINTLEQNGTEVIITEDEESTGLFTPEDFNLDPNMKIHISDTVLKDAVIKTLESIGTYPEDDPTIEDMFKIETIVISAPEYAQYAKGIIEPVAGESYVYENNETIKDFSKLYYAKNLKTLVVAGMDISAESTFAGIENLEAFVLIGGSEKMDFENLGVLGIDVKKLRFLYIEHSNLIHLGLDDFEFLTDLTITESSLAHLKELQGSINLTYIDISGNNMEYIDSSEFENFKSLKTLKIDGNIIEYGFDSLSIETLEHLVIDADLYNKSEDAMYELEQRGCEIEIIN